jgi:hypothetical protein
VKKTSKMRGELNEKQKRGMKGGGRENDRNR